MARIEAPKRDANHPNIVEFSGVKVDLDNLPLGGLAEISDQSARGDTFSIWDNWDGLPRKVGGERFAAWEQLEGKYSATDWVRRHPSKIHRYLRKRFHPKERDGRLTELINHPTKLRHLVMDGTRDPAEKLEMIIKHLGEAESEIITCEGRRGGGKALALDTLIATPSGWTMMGELRIGSIVLGKDGRPTRVTATSGVLHNRPCYRLTFDDGATIVADAEHLWVADLAHAIGTSTIAQIVTTQDLAAHLLTGGSVTIQPATFQGEGKAREPHHLKTVARCLSVPVQCIVVDNEDHLFLAGRAMVPTHNSTTVGVLAGRIHEEHDREIAYLDTRPKDKLPYFVKRIVDLRAADANMIIVVDEGAVQFTARGSSGNITLPTILATARHKGLTLIAITPSSSIMDVTFDKLSDGQIIKPTSMNQEGYARMGSGKVYSEFPEMIPSFKTPEWGVFVATKVAPTTFCLPYITCPPYAHKHGFPCTIPTWWTKDMSQSQIVKERQMNDPEMVSLAMELLYWDKDIVEIKSTMDRSGCVAPAFAWANMLDMKTNGIHPRTDLPLRFPDIKMWRSRYSDKYDGSEPIDTPRVKPLKVAGVTDEVRASQMEEIRRLRGKA